MKNDFLQRFREFPDEKLLEIIQYGKLQYKTIAVEAAQQILIERGYDHDMEINLLNFFKSLSDDKIIAIFQC